METDRLQRQGTMPCGLEMCTISWMRDAAMSDRAIPESTK